MSAPTVPTGILLGTFEPGSESWKQARAGLCITATEIAAVLGLSPWQSPYSLWHKKAGLPHPPFVSKPEMEWGIRHEPTVAAKWAEEHGDFGVEPTGTWRHAEREWQRATPDRLLTQQSRTTALLEVKTSPMGEGWGPSGSDDLPIYYRCQVQWQLDTLGLDICHVALLVSGFDYREYVIEHDETDAKTLRTAAEQFLQSVRDGRVPDIDGIEHTYNTLRMQPDRFDPVDVEIPGPIASDYEVIGQQFKAVGEQYTQAKSHLLAALGTGKNAVHLGRRIAYRVADQDGTTKQLQPAR